MMKSRSKTYDQVHEKYKAELFEDLEQVIKNWCARCGVRLDSEADMIDKLETLYFDLRS